MRSKNIYSILILFIVIISCNNSENPNNKPSEPEANFDSTFKHSEILAVVHNSSNIIGTRKWDLGDMEEEWKDAKVISYIDTIYLDDINASLKLEFNVLSKSNDNNILKEVTASILTSNKNYMLSVTISDQFNLGTEKAYSTCVTIDAFGVLNSNSRLNLKLTSKTVAIYSKNGEVETL